MVALYRPDNGNRVHFTYLIAMHQDDSKILATSPGAMNTQECVLDKSTYRGLLALKGINEELSL